VASPLASALASRMPLAAPILLWTPHSPLLLAPDRGSLGPVLGPILAPHPPVVTLSKPQHYLLSVLEDGQ
jgi:hypothetical protein